MGIRMSELEDRIEVLEAKVAALQQWFKKDITVLADYNFNHAESIESIISALERHEAKHKVGEITGIWS
jgi:ABC-type phosphate transport system auxiliary subunit